MTVNLQRVSDNANAVPAVMIGSRPTLISVPPMRFLIMDAPRQSNLHIYIKEMKKNSVSHVVRVCEPTYSKAELDNAGMNLHEMQYPDGHAPSQEIIDKWLGLVEDTFFKESSASSPCIAVHCVAGLGRAPVMVAIALIEFASYDPVEAVTMIRSHRRGAINEKQLLYLEGYKRHWKKTPRSGQDTCCIIL
jgi:protein tyrosine phosphatase type IVA